MPDINIFILTNLISLVHWSHIRQNNSYYTFRMSIKKVLTERFEMCWARKKNQL